MFQKHSHSKKEEMPRAETINPRKISPSILSADVRLLGNLMSDGVLDIDGRIEGNIKAEAVYVRSNAIITGDIMVASEAHIFGAVHGVIRAPRVCIYPSAHIEGAIIHRSLSIEDGAYVDAQFKPFDAQPRLSANPEVTKALQSLLNGSDADTKLKEGTLYEESPRTAAEEEYDILKDLKLIS